jgi:hypothetical protein
MGLGAAACRADGSSGLLGTGQVETYYFCASCGKAGGDGPTDATPGTGYNRDSAI